MLFAFGVDCFFIILNADLASRQSSVKSACTVGSRIFAGRYFLFFFCCAGYPNELVAARSQSCFRVDCGRLSQASQAMRALNFCLHLIFRLHECSNLIQLDKIPERLIRQPWHGMLNLPCAGPTNQMYILCMLHTTILRFFPWKSVLMFATTLYMCALLTLFTLSIHNNATLRSTLAHRTYRHPQFPAEVLSGRSVKYGKQLHYHLFCSKQCAFRAAAQSPLLFTHKIPCKCCVGVREFAHLLDNMKGKFDLTM